MNKLLFSCELCKRDLNLKEAIKYVLGEIEKLKGTIENKKSKDRTMPGGKMGVSLLKTALMLANS